MEGLVGTTTSEVTALVPELTEILANVVKALTSTVTDLQAVQLPLKVRSRIEKRLAVKDVTTLLGDVKKLVDDLLATGQ